jgi:hypothetical protein
VSETSVLVRAPEHAHLHVIPSVASTASPALGAIHRSDYCADWTQKESQVTTLGRCLRRALQACAAAGCLSLLHQAAPPLGAGAVLVWEVHKVQVGDGTL